MSNHNWHHTSECLRAIECHAASISHYCDSIKRHLPRLERTMKLLPDRPDWDTKAEDELKQSVESLRLALALCRSCLEAYMAKPYNPEPKEHDNAKHQ